MRQKRFTPNVLIGSFRMIGKAHLTFFLLFLFYLLSFVESHAAA